jgi:hypothetical protein
MTSATMAMLLFSVASSTLPLLLCNPKLPWLHLASSPAALPLVRAVHLLLRLQPPVPFSTQSFPNHLLSVFQCPFQQVLHRHPQLVNQPQHQTSHQLASLLSLLFPSSLLQLLQLHQLFQHLPHLLQATMPYLHLRHLEPTTHQLPTHCPNKAALAS